MKEVMCVEEGCVLLFCVLCFVVPRGQCIYYTYEERGDG